MAAAARRLLDDSLSPKENFDATDIPPVDSLDGEEFIWEQLLDGANEDGQLKSFFVVTLNSNKVREKLLFVSGDWPTAELFAKKIIGSAPVGI